MKKSLNTFIKIIIVLDIIAFSVVFVIIPFIKNKDKNCNIADTIKIASFAINYSNSKNANLKFDNIKDSLERIGYTGVKPTGLQLKVVDNNKTDNDVGIGAIYNGYCYHKSLIEDDVTYDKLEDNEECSIYGIVTNVSCFQVNGDMITGYKESCGKDIIVPEKINNVTIKSIDAKSFKDKNIDRVVISDSIEKIYESAFENSGLKELTLGDNVKNIGDKACYNNKLDKVIVSNSVEKIGLSAFEKNSITELTLGTSLTEISDYAFKENSLDYVNLVNVKVLAKGVFENNKITHLALSKVEIG